MSTRTAALITGASSGLGEQFAHRFARDGHDVILVARNEARLDALAERLRVHNVKAHVVVEDLAAPGAAERLLERVAALDLTVGFLVNNAGVGSSGPFLDQPLAREAEMVQLNCTALLELSHRVGQQMLARKAGRILNIASTAGFQPGPFMATYYATKAFVVSFTEALAHELQGSGVTVTCYCPGPTATEFGARSGNGTSRLFQRPDVAKAEDVVADAYEAMMQGEVLSVYGLLNWLAVQGVRFGPRGLVRSLVAGLNTKPD